ncbi:bifunctional folylpolyglutamate synthase/dihydrofolate synthase [Kovacikia minuta CCNUW1]|uniref:bifunctional folylpolyglutamate synthase/dihydrofolate synthase n=1 Tax=Kovacikia minuta TaxID=2931930 RepID=UPI001CCAB4B1|nr:folylpolyglutamate synthase/dihydrofolate synthase family protein [Kovacikia minuta]UBF29232.1 bifunctional folylpolyglutamate synthase/dihydrofolate synthase [Kovacikia minuta CCNUW1]
MDIDQTLQSFARFGVRLGLESIQQLLTNLGNPQARVPIVHVAGSNGKGSVCAYLSAVLTAAGYRVGRYTSPHLIDWCERICLNEQPISPADLEQVLQQTIAAIQPHDPPPTQFEVFTAAAWLYFAQQQVDIAVIEVGLGGRLDATNVCDRPLVSIITSISREHWQRLGPTLADIAGEKAGILKPGCAAVIGHLPPEARAVVDRRIAELKCPVVYPESAVDAGCGVRGEGCGEAEYQNIRYPLPLQGSIQLHNSALAISALLILQEQGWQISDEAIANGMAKTQWTGRLQWFTWQGHKILIDGAHNPASAEVLREFIDHQVSDVRCQVLGDRLQGTEYEVQTVQTSYPTPHTPHPTPTHWVMGMLSTKDHADVFKALLRPGDRLYLVPVPDHSSADPEELATIAHQVCPDLADCHTFPDVVTALATATAENVSRREDTPRQSLTVLCGSLYLIGHFFKLVGDGK